MKNRNFAFFALGLLFLILFSGQRSTAQNTQSYVQPIIPDVMGFVNVTDPAGKQFMLNVNQLDSFPQFGSFPKTISGTSFEGGIVCNMDADGELEIVYNIGYTVQAWNFDGTPVPGWPQTVASYGLEGAPAFGDIDGDGQDEIVVTNHGLTSGGFIYAFEKNGTAVTGFPINHGYSTRTPVLANLDNSGGLEIIVNKRIYPLGEVWVYRGNGTVYPGWPKGIGHVPASSAAVGDINNDGFVEIVMESYTGLYAWNRNGDSLAGFPFLMPNTDVNSYSSPVLADLDGDNQREIIFGTHYSGGGYVYVLRNNGTVMSGWPKQTGNWIYGPPSVGFIDGDNLLDIAVGDQVLSGSPANFLYAWNRNGTALTGFPIGPLWAINNQITLADIDNDISMELICDDNTQTDGRGKYLAFNHDGTPVVGWDVRTSGSTFFSTPMLADLNRDGMLDIAGSGGTTSPANTYVYLWNTGITYSSAKVITPMWQYNTRHNGVYGDNPLVGIEQVSQEVPSSFELMQNYPNPFNPVTKIRFSVPQNTGNASFVKLAVYDMLGRQVSLLVNENMSAGSYAVEWNASSMPSGVYFYTLTAGGKSFTNKMALIK